MPSTVLERPVSVPLQRTAEVPVSLPRRRFPTAGLLAVMMAAAGVAWSLEHASTLRRSATVLAGLQPGWLLLAALAAGSTWVWSALSQQGAVGEQLPRGQLLAVQVAGTFAGTFTPAGLGGSAVNVRFLRKRGGSYAVAAVALTQLAGVVVHTLLLLVVLALDPSLLSRADLTGPQAPSWLPFVGVTVAVAAVVGLVFARDWITGRLSSLHRQARAGTSHLRTPRRVAELLLGSIGLTVAHVLVLFALLRALGTAPGVLEVAAAYLLATTAAALLPTPNGLGGLDACLAVLLLGAGIGTATAVAAVLAYRLLTSWLALVPSAVTLNVLVRKGIV